MDIRKIKKLIDLLEDTCVTEIEIQEGDYAIRVCRGNPNTVVTQGSMPSHSMPTPSVSASTPLDASFSAPTASSVKASEAPYASSGHTIRSPMVGTLYSAASPDAPPFVAIGQKIKAGDTLCIIEAMKMFNEVEADKSGTLIDILVKNGEPVEYDQPLFIIQE